jgi:hypothetical protein
VDLRSFCPLRNDAVRRWRVTTRRRGDHVTLPTGTSRGLRDGESSRLTSRSAGTVFAAPTAAHRPEQSQYVPGPQSASPTQSCAHVPVPRRTPERRVSIPLAYAGRWCRLRGVRAASIAAARPAGAGVVICRALPVARAPRGVAERAEGALLVVPACHRVREQILDRAQVAYADATVHTNRASGGSAGAKITRRRADHERGDPMPCLQHVACPSLRCTVVKFAT